MNDLEGGTHHSFLKNSSQTLYSQVGSCPELDTIFGNAYAIHGDAINHDSEVGDPANP